MFTWETLQWKPYKLIKCVLQLFNPMACSSNDFTCIQMFAKSLQHNTELKLIGYTYQSSQSYHTIKLLLRQYSVVKVTQTSVKHYFM